MNFPSRYRDLLRGVTDWQVAREILMKKKKLKIFGFVTAGGAAAFGKNPDPVFRKTGYNNKVVVVDEIHMLTRPEKDRQRYKKQHKKLIESLYAAKNTVLYAFTGTLYDNVLEEARQILDIVKGKDNADASDEGFLFHNMSYSPKVYAGVRGGVPESKLPTIISGPMSGLNELVYLEKEQVALKRYKDVDKIYKFLQPYCNASTSYGAMTKAWLKRAKSDPASYCTKLAAVAALVGKRIAKRQKVLVLLQRRNGYKAASEVIKYAVGGECEEGGNKDNCVLSFYAQPGVSARANAAKSSKNLDAFNGSSEQTRIAAVADSRDYGTGVSFLGVSTLVLVDVPADATAYIQLCGRALRACDGDVRHRVLDIVMFASSLADGRLSSDDYHVLKLQQSLQERGEIERELQCVSVH